LATEDTTEKVKFSSRFFLQYIAYYYIITISHVTAIPHRYQCDGCPQFF
jgi:hypothetical protein